MLRRMSAGTASGAAMRCLSASDRNTVLLLALLLRLTKALWPSVFAAALFAWHPLHVESVAWISERKDMLSTFFGLAALSVHIGDLAIHAWDLAVARGSTLELPDDVAVDALGTWEDVFTRLNRGTAFGEEVDVAADASPTARLVAYCGRTP